MKAFVAALVVLGAAATAEPPEGMVYVPEGEAWIGDDEGDPNEGPRRRVAVHAFFIDRTEVTNEAYAVFVEETGRTSPGTGVDWATRWAWQGGKPRSGTEGDPVFLVTWDDADAFCQWADKRLPTELEWERAARGDDGRRWSWGDSWESPEARGNWFDGGEADGHTHVARADAYTAGASPFGALNMTGNVWEWVAEPYVERPWEPDPQAHEAYRVVRGGSWYTNNWYWMRASFRYFLPGDEVSTIYGFRCAADTPSSAP